MLISVFLVYRIVNSRFGMALRAAKSNEARTRAIGFSPYPYRLAAFVIAGAMCGLAGALYANHTNYITPGLMSWQQSGDIMFMVILGGMATTSGPVLGAFALLLVEDLLVGLDAALAGHPRAAAGALGDLLPARPRRNLLQSRCLKSGDCPRASARCAPATASTSTCGKAKPTP